MDRQYPTPRDVSNASPEQLQRSLRRVLASLDAPTEFLYESEFAYANGRKGPLLMVGALRGAWRDHIRRNAASPRFCAGTCSPHRADDGRVTLDLVAARGRARGAAHQRTMNLSIMRGIGEVRFVDADTAPTAATEAAPTARPAEAPAAAPSEAPPSAVTAAAILSGFADFKTKPTLDKLAALAATIESWRAAGAGEGDAGQIDKIATLLRDKGRAYVASKGG